MFCTKSNPPLLEYGIFVKDVLGLTKQDSSNLKENSTGTRGIVLLEIFRKKLVEKGIKGILELEKNFKQISHGNNEVNKFEFIKVSKDCKILSDSEDVEIIFKELDSDTNGIIDYQLFLQKLKNNFNNLRLEITSQAFENIEKLNKPQKSDDMQKGQDPKKIRNEFSIYYKGISKAYNAKKHPAVLQGRKTINQALNEFVEVIELYKIIKSKKDDDILTKNDFIEIYRNISFTIDSDSYFNELLRNSWNLDQLPMDINNIKIKEESQKTHIVKEMASDKASKNEKIEEVKEIEDHKDDIDILKFFNNEFLKRGLFTIFGIERHFKIYDKDKTGFLNLENLKSVFEDFRIGNDILVEKLYRKLDPENKGKIQKEVVLKMCLGEVSQERLNLINLAFLSINKGQKDKIEIRSIINVFDSKKHPDAVSGRKQPNDILHEFLELLEKYIEMIREVKSDGFVNQNEFISYYSYISAFYQSNEDFESMMKTVWNIQPTPSQPHLILTQTSSALPIIDNNEIEITEQKGITKSISTKEETGLNIGEVNDSPKKQVNILSEENKDKQKEMTFKHIIIYLKSSLSNDEKILKLKQSLRDYGNEKNGIVSSSQILSSLKLVDIELSQTNLKKLMNLFDRSNSGECNSKDLISLMVPALNELRKSIVYKAFAILDRTKSNKIPISELAKAINIEEFPKVKNNEIHKIEYLAYILDCFEQVNELRKPKSIEGFVTIDDFIEYFTIQSLNIEKDYDFEKLVMLFSNIQPS